MENRIRKFMEYKSLSSSELADSIGVQRSNVTHVLQGRNKPSFQFIEKLLHAYPELNAKWLLLGSGPMVDNPGKARTLFDQEGEVPVSAVRAAAPVQETMTEPIPSSKSATAIEEEKITPKQELKDQFFSSEKAIERLIVFYKDQTFKVYNPSL